MKLSCVLMFVFAGLLVGQEKASEEKATGQGEPSGTPEMKHRIVIESPDPKEEPSFIFQTSILAKARLLEGRIEETAEIEFAVVQGKPGLFSLEVVGSGPVTGVSGEQVKSWALRQEGEKRFLDIATAEAEIGTMQVTVVSERNDLKMPGQFALTSFGPTGSAGFAAQYVITSGEGLRHRLVKAVGVVKLAGDDDEDRLLSNSRAELAATTELSAAAPPPAELRGVRLVGEILPKAGSANFRLIGTAHVTSEDPVSLTVLSGRAAPMEAVATPDYRLKLSPGGYQLEFARAGVFPIDLGFVTPLQANGEWKQIDFRVASAAVVPVELTGIPQSVVFDPALVVNPVWRGEKYEGFLPASGRCHFAWQPERKGSDGELFFTSEAMGEISVGAGLVRQMTSLTVKTLQGALPALALQLAGSGEVLAVEGENVLSWQVNEERVLEILLSRPVTREASFVIRSQAALSALPVTLEPLRMTPVGVVRHSGYFRIYNRGAVRIEVMQPAGLTQLSPDQYPDAAALGDSVRQVFHYRYPSANRSFQVAAERVEPEINASQTLSYELTETDRVLRADLELEIREAGIREWEFYGPAEYSVVSLTGAGVADYVLGEVREGRRRLKVIFAEEMMGRRLVKVHFEKNEPATEGRWALPGLSFPGTTMVRGEIGVSASPGFRVSPGEVEGLSEMPLARLLKRGPDLQQAFRIRSADWQAEMVIKALSQNVQTDTYHFYSLQEGTAYVSVLLNYFVAGAPVDEWQLTVPAGVENLSVDGRDIRDYRESEGALTVPLHRPVMGAYQLLVTYEQDAGESLVLGGVVAQGVQAERGFIEVVSPGQVELTTSEGGQSLQLLDPLELPTEYQLMSSAPTLRAWQYQRRPFALTVEISWFRRGETAKQVVEFAEMTSQLARDGGALTESSFEVRTRDGQELKLSLPEKVEIREVSVDGEAVTLRKAGDLFLVPLPESVSPKVPVRLTVVSSQRGDGEEEIRLAVPILHDTTQLETKWTVKPDSGYRLRPVASGALALLSDFSMENGLDWIERNALPSFAILLVAWVLGNALLKRSPGLAMAGAALVLFAAAGAFSLVPGGLAQTVELPGELEYRAPVKAPDAIIGLTVAQVEEGERAISTTGWICGVLALVAMAGAFYQPRWRRLLLSTGALLFAFAILWQPGGAGLFFLILGLVILLRWWGIVRKNLDQWKRACKRHPKKRESQEEKGKGETGPGAKGAATALLVAGLCLGAATGSARGQEQKESPQVAAADSLSESWAIAGRRLQAEGQLQVTGEAGERFLLMRGPATLTAFQGEDLKVMTDGGDYYVVPRQKGTFQATFRYEAPVGDVTQGVPVLSGLAAVRNLTVRYEAAGWSIESAAAVRQQSLEGRGSAARLWLAPVTDATVVLSPKARDVASEEVRFYAEVDDLFVPGPGVVDGRHRVKIRPAQGQVKELSLLVPEGFTVSEVRSQLVGPWRFDPVGRILRIELSPYQAKPFYIDIETQLAVAELPVEVSVAPMRVKGAAGEVGMLALAFGKEAQLDRDQAEGMSPVNLADFNTGILPRDSEGRPTVSLQKVYRYSGEPASLSLGVAPVAPEVRVGTKERLSFGEERVVLAVDLAVAITRAGVFRLSFPLPSGFEVESLSGAALNHWVEVNGEGGRRVVMNLNGKTMGEQTFSLVLTGATPALPLESWAVPKVVLQEASRQSGELLIIPGRGIQLRVADRKDLSALDPRSAGGSQAGSLAFRLLQKSWQLTLAVDQLAPSVAAQVLQDVELREGRSKSRVEVRLRVDHASIREIAVALPELSTVDAQTVRVSGPEVRDILAREGGGWQVRFKRRVVGEVPLRIEYEESVPRAKVEPVRVTGARQQESYLALRPGARLRLEMRSAPDWDAVDWAVLPKTLFQLDRSGAPAVFLRTAQDGGVVEVSLTRHSVVSGAKVRVIQGSLESVLSREGELMNQAELELEARQRGSVTLTLPSHSRLFGVFVNEESVLVVRDGESYRFQVTGDAVAGREDRARVRFTYANSLAEADLASLQLEAFKIGVPLENVSWRVSLPKGYVLASSSGDLDLEESGENGVVTREDYLGLVQAKNAAQDRLAVMRLNKASEFFKAGNQIQGNLALAQVYNQGNLDAASNEDVQVKMNNVAKQNAIIGLNTRRQRLYNDNGGAAVAGQQDELDQIQTAMRSNPVFTGQLNIDQDDFSRILRGNNADVNRMLDTIASKWVRNQRITEPTGQMIDPVIPVSGKTVTFNRMIQVDGEDVLNLGLELEPEAETSEKGGRIVIFLLVVICVFLGARRGAGRQKSAKASR